MGRSERSKFVEVGNNRIDNLPKLFRIGRNFFIKWTRVPAPIFSTMFQKIIPIISPMKKRILFTTKQILLLIFNLFSASANQRSLSNNLKTGLGYPSSHFADITRPRCRSYDFAPKLNIIYNSCISDRMLHRCKKF